MISEKDKVEAQNTAPTPKKQASPNRSKPSRYINPLTDFGFKYLFGAKDLLIDFLNGILDVDSGIVDLTYENTERIPHSKHERIARFDLHCTTGTGERIIIEMQNNSQDFFRDRTVYYITFPIQEQAPKGKWGMICLPDSRIMFLKNFSKWLKLQNCRQKTEKNITDHLKVIET